MAEQLQPAPFRNFKGMCWPVPGKQLEELEDALRYEPKTAWLDMKDRLLAASVIAAYRDLVWSTNAKRNEVSRELRKGPGIADDVNPPSGKD
jgi:hypothetical protein